MFMVYFIWILILYAGGEYVPSVCTVYLSFLTTVVFGKWITSVDGLADVFLELSRYRYVCTQYDVTLLMKAVDSMVRLVSFYMCLTLLYTECLVGILGLFCIPVGVPLSIFYNLC